MVYNPDDRKLTKRDLYKIACRSLFLQASFNYERMQATGWLYSILPALKKIYKDNADELKRAMKSHLEIFNSHPFLVPLILGIIASMEEKGENRDTIKRVKSALMSSLGGIGDSIVWLMIFPICAGLGISLAVQGNLLGPILFLILFNVVHFILIFGGIKYGYREGLNILTSLKTYTKFISSFASIIGLIMVGALIALYVDIKTPVVIKLGKIEILASNGILDNILPLIFTFFVYWLFKKGLSSNKVIGITILLGIICRYLGIL